MNRRQYWKNRVPFLLTNLICMVALTVFLLVCGNSISEVFLILAVWTLILLATEPTNAAASGHGRTAF